MGGWRNTGRKLNNPNPRPCMPSAASLPASAKVSDPRPIPAPQIRCGCFQEAACLGCQGESRLGIVAETDNHGSKTFTCSVFPFCLQGVQLLFSQILQYIPKLRKELQLGQVRKHPCVTCCFFFLFFFETSQDVP